MNRIGTSTIVFVALAAAIAGVDSAPLDTENQESTTICSDHGVQSITKWPRNVVPYMIGSNLTGSARTRLMDSMHYLENSSCVLFIPRTDEQDYVFFKMSSRCCSHMGKMGQGKQEVYFSDNCLREGINVDRVLNYLIGDASTTPVAPSDSESSSSESPSTDEQQTDSSLSQTIASSCTNSCLSCTLLQPDNDGSDSSYGVVTSPNYPNDYPSLSDCLWKFIAPTGYFISLRFLADLDLEGGSNCKYDYLDIFLLDSRGELLVDKKHYCGVKSASVLNSDLSITDEMHTHAVVIQFHSDSTYTGAGFQLAYNLQANRSDPCSTNNGGCEQICTNNGYVDASCSCRQGFTLAEDGQSCRQIDLCELKYKAGGCQQRCSNKNGSYHCFCKPGYRLDEDQRTCLECGGVYNDSRGVFQSQNFPLPYPYEQNCKWTVHAWPDHYLRISITNMDIFPTERCMGDFLKLEKGRFPHQSRLCGHYSDISYVVNSSTYIRFRSKTSNTNYGGFQLEFTQVHDDDLSYIERNFVTINGRYTPYDDRLWTLPSL